MLPILEPLIPLTRIHIWIHSNLGQVYMIVNIHSKVDFNTYEMYSFTGQLIHSGKFINSIDLSSIDRGIYFLKLIGNKIEHYKIIK